MIELLRLPKFNVYRSLIIENGITLESLSELPDKDLKKFLTEELKVGILDTNKIVKAIYGSLSQFIDESEAPVTLLKTGDKVMLKSWKGDYLHRPDSDQGVTTWNTGIGNVWTVEREGDSLNLLSWKGDYLFRVHGEQGVGTTSERNERTTWKIQTTSNGKALMLKSCVGDGLHRPDSDQGVTTWAVGVGNEWTLEKTQ